MDAKGSLGHSEINVVPYDSSKLRIKEMTIRGWVEPDRPIRFMLPFLDSTKVLISVKGLESGVVDGLANPGTLDSMGRKLMIGVNTNDPERVAFQSVFSHSWRF